MYYQRMVTRLEKQLFTHLVLKTSILFFVVCCNFRTTQEVLEVGYLQVLTYILHLGVQDEITIPARHVILMLIPMKTMTV